MFASSDLNACAALVERGDPERFLAVMAAPVEARQGLFPLFAFNLEVARAPWVTQQPMLAEMRLQWWSEALSEIAQKKNVRRHEVVTPLAALIDARAAVFLQDLISARRWDIYHDPFQTVAEFEHYIDCTSGHLLVVAAGLLGVSDPQVIRDFAFAAGLANWFRAVPQFLAQQRHPLVDLSSGSLRALAEHGLMRLALARKKRRAVSSGSGVVLLCGWQAQSYLTEAFDHPDRVLLGLRGPRPFASKARLLAQSVTGRW